MKFYLYQTLRSSVADEDVELELECDSEFVPRKWDKVKVAGVAGYFAVVSTLYITGSGRVEVLLVPAQVFGTLDSALGKYLSRGWKHAPRTDAPAGLDETPGV
jgi:hypothetical protein